MGKLPHSTDVLIVGGGPAGLAAAIALRQRKIDCVVVEALRPAIDKGCGEGLMPDALRSLHQLGVEISDNDGHAFRGIRFANQSHVVDSYFPDGYGIGVRRTKLHERLVQRAESAGVAIRWDTRPQRLTSNSVFIDGEEVRFRYLVGADGQASLIRKRAGLDRARHESLRFGFRRHYKISPWSEYVEVHWGPYGQVYTTPVGNENVCVLYITRDLNGGRYEAIEQFPQIAEKLRGVPLLSAQRGAVSATRKLKRVVSGQVALVGDASGSPDAITGEGLAICFRQAIALADAIAHDDLARYSAAHREIAKLPQAMSKLMLTMDRWPTLERKALEVLSSTPRYFERLLSVHVGDTSLRGFVLRHGAGMGWNLLRA